MSSGFEISEYEYEEDEIEPAPRRRIQLEPLALPALVVVGAIIGLLDDASPTGLSRADQFWRAVSGAAIVLCAAFAPPLAWLVAAGGAAASSTEPSLITVGAVTIVVAALAAFRFAWVPWAGGTVGLGVAWVVFRLPHDDIMGTSTVVAAAIVGVLLFGAWFWGPDGVARYFTYAAVAVGVASVVAAIALGVALAGARNQITDALDLADDATTSFRDGNEVRARDQLSDAVAKLTSAENTTSSTWVEATRLIPVVGQHTNAVQTVVSSGRRSADAALEVLNQVDRDELAIKGGAVNLDAIIDITPAVANLADATAATRTDLASVRNRWLLPPLRNSLDDANDEIREVADASRRAADAARLAPGMLGGDGPKNHLVLLVTTSELRGSGGLIGNWALVQANQGRLVLDSVGRAEDINNLLAPKSFELTEPARYVERYAQNEVENEFQDITLSPDFPDVASVAAQLFETATGTQVDSVMMVDPEGMAAIMALTGPVQVDGQTVTSDNVASFLLLDQYVAFPDDADRVAFLDELMTQTFANLLTIDFQDPWDLDEVFGDVVDEDRLVISALVTEENDLLGELGVAGAFPLIPEGAADLLGVVTQNGGQNKADTFLERRVEYDAVVDPITGVVEASVVVELENTLSDLLLPRPVVGSNDQGLPSGTNKLAVTVYSPHTLVEARIDGVESGMQVVREFDVNSFTRVLEIPFGETVRVELDLEGQISLTDKYRLVIPVQPAVNDDRFRLRIGATRGTLLDGSRTSWQTSFTTAADQRFVIDVELPS